MNKLLKYNFYDQNASSSFFDSEWMFGIKDGFDIVIGNPPYGGQKISDKLKNKLELSSKDIYGAFISRSLETEPFLNKNGLLALIVSDTFMTIKTHKPLRQQMLKHKIHKMIQVNPEVFDAMVNPVILFVERCEKAISDNHKCVMADMKNINIYDELFNELVYDIDDKRTSNETYAIYEYPQNLIKTNSNIPFFVASPKLFALMNDVTAPIVKSNINGKDVSVRTIKLNDKDIKLVKFGDITEVKQGLATGDNNAYLFQNPEARGSYRSIERYKEYLLTDDDLSKIRNNEKLRLQIIEKGISKDDISSECYFGGRYIVPYDKGGASNVADGWLPNYYVPTDYFIDWSEWAVKKMKTYTIAQRIVDRNENKTILEHYHTQPAAVFRNTDTYFKVSIGFSDTGVYAPTFRLNSSSVYDVMSMSIFVNKDLKQFFGLLASKLIKSLIKNFVNSTIHTQVEGLRSAPIILNIKLEEIINSIFKNQKQNPRYDYASNEQIEIDRLIYEAYGLNVDDILEVENWYVRRYTKLSKAQKANLIALGKSDDYLKLYGLK